MVLSLGFIIAFIGAAVALLIGILIFSEVEEAILCPTTGTAGGFLINTNPYVSMNQDGLTTLPGRMAGQLIATSGEQISSITVNNMSSASGGGTVKGQIYTGATLDIATSTFVANSSNTLNVSPFTDLNFTWIFTPAVTVNDPNTYITLIGENLDSDVWLPVTAVNFTGDIGPGVALGHAALIPTFGFYTPTLHDVFPTEGAADVFMQVALLSVEDQQGSAECQQAKDTAWTVIGILPVALFFALFAIFGSLGRTS